VFGTRSDPNALITPADDPIEFDLMADVLGQ
jgi:hypothetical protein